MNREVLIEELCQKNTVLSQLFGDWIDVRSPSFWRFFKNEKSFRLWEKTLRDIMKQHDCSNLHMFKSDTKGLVMVLDHCVVRTYRTNLFLKIRPLYRLRNPYLEKCLMSRQLDHVGVFICKKIQPLLDTSGMDVRLSLQFTPALFEQMLKDVEKAISKIHSYGYCHNDISLDNTGYDKETKTFVVFDFDAAKRLTVFDRKHLCLDRTSWERSLKSWSRFFPVK
jgi:hypothetical protein